ncbi:hypothetical protein ACFY4C_22880 [Actinomadura viridis]|uniref:hypothetical protein n=1 Tax=Actinomadura viridis TaxID=58110 RepID=UPI00367E935F
MIQGSDSEASGLTRRQVGVLAAEFPDWLISREGSGRWTAIKPRWGALYGQSAIELRDRLRRYSEEGDVR